MEKKKVVQNETKEKDPRFVRRLRAKKQETLTTLINLFFTYRSDLKDTEGEEADALFTKYRNMWIAECKEFNKSKNRPFTLRGAAFSDQVSKILEMEKNSKKKVKEENETKEFKKWFDKNGGWKNNFFLSLLYWIKTSGDKTEQERLWKHYFINKVL
jgi:hypothetical protein